MAADRRTSFGLSLLRFRKDETGSMTVWGLFVWFVSGILGAIALDYTHLVAARTNLQVVADQAGHAAIFLRYRRGDAADVGQIKTDAAALALASLPAGQYGTVLSTTDINFGTFDSATQTFTVDESSVDAVRVRTYFNRDNGNPAVSFLFRLIGRDDFNVAAQSVWVVEGKACLSEGFIANGVVDVTSNNTFGSGFCIHSNDHVAVQQNNAYSYGEVDGDGNPLDPTIVSMPDANNLGLPGGVVVDDDDNVLEGNFDNNPNLDMILASDTMSIDFIFLQMENMIAQYRGETPPHSIEAAGTTPGWPTFIQSLYRDPIDVSWDNSKLTVAELMQIGSQIEVPVLDDDGNPVRERGKFLTEMVDRPGGATGRVYDISCGANGTLTIDAKDVPLSDVMIITDCDIKFEQGSTVSNARIITTSTNVKSIEAPSGLTIGNGGAGCTGGAQFVTLGGVDFAASVGFQASQIIASGDISFTANGDGQTGVSLIAGGDITATANGDMNVCNSGIFNGMTFKQIRMVM